MRHILLALPLLALIPVTAAEAQVPGTYRRTCTNISQDGPILTATCRAARGQFAQSTLNTEDCGRIDIVNSNGRLVCGQNRGSLRPVAGYGGGYGGGGYGGPRRYDPDNGGYAPPRSRYAPPDQDDGYAPPPPRRRYDPNQDY